jgi:protein ImuB
MSRERVLVLWVPDWPVLAAFGIQAREDTVAVTHGNDIVACSAAARAQGVRRGQRRRLAQSLCADLKFVPIDPQRDERAFLPLLRALDAEVPGVMPLRPGLVAFRARGPARYYGGERQAAEHLLGTLASLGHPDARAGVADGLFTAERAARQASADDPCLIVMPGEASTFLAPLPVRLLGDDQTTALLEKLGVRTMADFANLAEADVRARLGEAGVRLRALASGADSRAVTAQPPTDELAREIVFETPLEQTEQIGFAVRQTADAVIDALGQASFVCTEIRIDLTDDRGEFTSRSWMHPSYFAAPDIVDRVRWQLESVRSGQAAEPADDNRVTAGITEVRITPVTIDSLAHHQPGLFGQGGEDRLHHGVSRVQTLLGHQAVTIGAIGGGRLLAERQRHTPWGDRTRADVTATQPWPGQLPTPLPTEVFDPPRPVRVQGPDGEAIEIDERGMLSASPTLVDGVTVVAWAGPWPLRERVWDAARGHRSHRLQLLDERQRAWVVLCQGQGDLPAQWHAEGIYR